MSSWQPRADLHAHSVCSDGTMTPEEVARLADLKGLAWFSLTDHDVISGISRVRSELHRIESPVDLIAGSELTCYDDRGREWHVLAYGFDENNPCVSQFLDARVKEREERVVHIVDRLQQQGFDISLEDITSISRGGAIGRLHVAKAMLSRGIVNTIAEAFRGWLIQGAPAYVPKKEISPEEIVAEIHSWDGVAIIAHPFQFESIDEIEGYLDTGIDGVEAYHPNIDKPLRKALKKLARQRGLLVTGGSDSHGQGYNRPQIGTVTVPEHFVQALIERIAEGVKTS